MCWRGRGPYDGPPPGGLPAGGAPPSSLGVCATEQSNILLIELMTSDCLLLPSAVTVTNLQTCKPSFWPFGNDLLVFVFQETFISVFVQRRCGRRLSAFSVLPVPCKAKLKRHRRKFPCPYSVKGDAALLWTISERMNRTCEPTTRHHRAIMIASWIFAFLSAAFAAQYHFRIRSKTLRTAAFSFFRFTSSV